MQASAPSFEQRQEERKAEHDRIVKEAQDRRRTNLDAQSDPTHSRYFMYNSQPYKYGKPIGVQGFKYLKTFKANDGDHYAEYQHVRGGAGRRYYNLVTEQWENNKYLDSRWCNNCNNSFAAMRPGLNTCPNCGVQQDLKV